MDDNRQTMEADIVCVGFGPAMGGFLTTLSKGLVKEDGSPVVESAVMPGMPLQVICYERADDPGLGVSGVVTGARAIRETFPGLKPSDVPMCSRITEEKVVYLLDPVGASRRPWLMRAKDKVIRSLGDRLPFSHDDAVELPYIPPFCKNTTASPSPSASSTNGWPTRSWPAAWRKSGPPRRWPRR